MTSLSDRRSRICLGSLFAASSAPPSQDRHFVRQGVRLEPQDLIGVVRPPHNDRQAFGELKSNVLQPAGPARRAVNVRANSRIHHV